MGVGEIGDGEDGVFSNKHFFFFMYVWLYTHSICASKAAHMPVTKYSKGERLIGVRHRYSR